MFGNKLAAAEAKLATHAVLLAGIASALGLKPEELTFEAFTAAQLGASQASAEAATSIQLLNTEVTGLKASSTAVAAGLKAAGLELPAELTPESVKAALEAHTVKAAATQVAQSGHEPLALAPESVGVKTKAELRAEFEALTDPQVRAAFYAQNKAKLLN
jgi:hypothetical protein